MNLHILTAKLGREWNMRTPTLWSSTSWKTTCGSCPTPTSSSPTLPSWKLNLDQFFVCWDCKMGKKHPKQLRASSSVGQSWRSCPSVLSS
eukprot:705585-Amphidinium_carterae.2